MYGMTLLSLIAFVYLLFAYQNHLNKKVQKNESSDSKVPLGQQGKRSEVFNGEAADAFEPSIVTEAENNSDNAFATYIDSEAEQTADTA